MADPYPVLGLIEGFYGRSWPQEARLQMIRWASALGLHCYLYAPKDDALLRRAWRQRWPPGQRRRLAALARAGAAVGMEVSAGLSPFALYHAYDRPARTALQSRVREIADTGVHALALLFDDMPGGVDALAERQAEIAADVQHWIAPLTLRLCPTYYSDDPVLDRVFGERPAPYLEELGRALPPRIPLFWTGERVCAEEIRYDHVADVARRCARPLALWDNYPVNDGRVRSEHLYLAPLDRRDRLDATIAESHWCNAMNQPALSLPALASLAALYAGRSEAPAAQEQAFGEAGITPALIEACLPLAERKRSTLDGDLLAALRSRAGAETPAARELAGWLAGEYRFDPACLTD